MRNLDPQAITFSGPRGPVPGVLYTPDDRPCPADLVLVAHGGMVGKENVLGTASRLASRLGVAALAIDAPSHGARTSAAGELERFKLARRHLNSPAFPAEWATDWRGCVRELRHQGVGGQSLTYVGSSMSAIAGVAVLVELGDVDTAVLCHGGIGDTETMLAALRDVADTLVGPGAADILQAEENLGRRRQQLLDAAGRLATTEVLMVNGSRDPLVSPTGALDLFNALQCPKRLMFFDAGHDQNPDAWEAILAFLATRLSGSREYCPTDVPSGKSDQR